MSDCLGHMDWLVLTAAALPCSNALHMGRDDPILATISLPQPSTGSGVTRQTAQNKLEIFYKLHICDRHCMNGHKHPRRIGPEISNPPCDSSPGR